MKVNKVGSYFAHNVFMFYIFKNYTYKIVSMWLVVQDFFLSCFPFKAIRGWSMDASPKEESPKDNTQGQLRISSFARDQKSESKSTDTPKETSEEASKDTSVVDTPINAPEDTPEESSMDVPEDTPQDAPEDTPQDTPEDNPQDNPEDAPEDTPEDADTATESE